MGDCVEASANDAVISLMGIGIVADEGCALR